MSKVIVADWDGTLLDSTQTYFDAFVKIVKEKYGSPEHLIVAHIIEHNGLPVNEIFSSFIRKTQGRTLSEKELEDFERLYSKHVDDHIQKAPLFEDVMPFLSKLRKHNIRLYVSSSGRPYRMVQRAQQLLDHGLVHDIFGFDPEKNFKKGKTHFDEVFRREVADGNTNPELVFLGDTLHDIEVAKERGLTPYIRVKFLSKQDIIKHGGIPFKHLKEVLRKI